MSKKADPDKYYAKRSVPLKADTAAAKAHLPRANDDLPF